MRVPLRLRNHPIDSCATQTESPRIALLFAILAAAGVLLPWAEGIRWSKHGWSYELGVVALAAASEAAIVYGLRASGSINRRQYLTFGLPAAFVGLAATVWFYFDVVGSEDPIVYRTLMSFFKMPRTAGAVGFYLSMAGFIGQFVVLLWDLDHGFRNVVRSTLGSPRTTAFFIAVSAVGVLLQWPQDFVHSKPGWSFNLGLVVLVAATEAGIVCALRIRDNIRAIPYAILGLLCASAGLAAVVWVQHDVVRHVEPSGYAVLVSWLNAPRTGEGYKLYVSAAGFVGMIVVLSWQLWRVGRDGELSVRWPWTRTARAG